MYKFVLGVFSCLVSALPAFAQVQLEWKLQPKDKFFVEIRTLNEQKTWVLQPVTSPQEAARSATSLLICAGQPHLHLLQSQWVGQRFVEGRQRVETLTVLQFEVVEKNDKETVLEQTIVGAQIARAAPPDGKEKWRLKWDKPPSKTFGTLFKNLKLKVTLGPSLETSNIVVDGYDDMLKHLMEKNPEADKEIARFKAICSESLLKQQLRDLFGNLPAKKVNKADTWTEDTSEDLPALGKITRHTTFEYQGEQDSIHRIVSTSTLKYTSADSTGSEQPLKSAALPFKIIRGELNSEEAKGAILFSAATGRLLGKSSSCLLTGALTLRFIDLDEAAEVTCFVRQKIETSVNLLDQLLPTPPPPPRR